MNPQTQHLSSGAVTWSLARLFRKPPQLKLTVPPVCIPSLLREGEQPLHGAQPSQLHRRTGAAAPPWTPNSERSVSGFRGATVISTAFVGPGGGPWTLAPGRREAPAGLALGWVGCVSVRAGKCSPASDDPPGGARKGLPSSMLLPIPAPYECSQRGPMGCTVAVPNWDVGTEASDQRLCPLMPLPRLQRPQGLPPQPTRGHPMGLCVLGAKTPHLTLGAFLVGRTIKERIWNQWSGAFLSHPLPAGHSLWQVGG